jgi:hypothetical protein
MATDVEVIDGVFEPLSVEELEVPTETLSPTQGSNLINLSPLVVQFVLARLRAGRTLKEIKRLVKENHPQHKSISWDQLRMIVRRRKELYLQKVAATNPEPVE